jgi:hypothetical protein
MPVMDSVMIEEEVRAAAPEGAESPPVPVATTPIRPDLGATLAARAHALWEASGRVPGRELDFWLRAENELFGSGDGPTA